MSFENIGGQNESAPNSCCAKRCTVNSVASY